jgi:hypothetical protein
LNIGAAQSKHTHAPHLYNALRELLDSGWSVSQTAHVGWVHLLHYPSTVDL